jgi:5-methyltetrahydrofolate--homocysteine methyltransferase
MNTLIQGLIGKGPALTDGAWGTQMQARGLGIGEFPDLWNLSHPEQVLAVAQSYVDAGSRVILTNTFGANRIRLAEAGAVDRLMEINREGVRISKEAARGKAKVFASIGPSGKMLMAGEVTPEELIEAYAEQAIAMAEAGADALLIETMADLEEALLAVQGAKRTGLPVGASIVFDSGKDKDRTMMGSTPEQVAEALAAAGVDVVGANCGLGIEFFAPICRRLKAASGLPVWMKPNAGMPEMVAGTTVYKTGAETFSSQVPLLIEAGADFIGACCGSTPEFIQTTNKFLSTKN